MRSQRSLKNELALLEQWQVAGSGTDQLWCDNQGHIRRRASIATYNEPLHCYPMRLRPVPAGH